jgi:hypothetical protein
MRKGNAVQLRLALSAAAVCAVLAAAILSGGHRTELPPVKTIQQTEPILVRSISTARKLGEGAGGDADRTAFPIGIQDEGSATAKEAAVLTSTLALAGELAAAARLRLGTVIRR